MNILWTAPHDFLPEELFDISWGKVWFDLSGFNHYEAWVVDPLKRVVPRNVWDCPKLKVIATPSTGTNHIPLDACRKKGIDVLCLLDDRTNLQDITASSEFTFLLVLAALRNLHLGIEEASLKRWHTHEHILRGSELKGKTVGLVGFGRIGQNTLRYCKAFGVRNFLVYDPHMPSKPVEPLVVPLERLFSESDVIVVCCSLTSETEGMMGESLFEKMKQSAVLVNTSRGEVLVEKELASVLYRRPDLRVAVDVLGGEVSGVHLASPLLNMRNVLVTPHMAGTTIESQTRAAEIILDLLKGFEDEFEDEMETESN